MPPQLYNLGLTEEELELLDYIVSSFRATLRATHAHRDLSVLPTGETLGHDLSTDIVEAETDEAMGVAETESWPELETFEAKVRGAWSVPRTIPLFRSRRYRRLRHIRCRYRRLPWLGR